VAGAGQLAAGNVDLGATGWLLLGSIPGVLVGGRMTVKLPDRTLRVALATVLALAGVKLIDFRGADTVLLIGIVLATSVGVIALAREIIIRGRAAEG
jgi:multisubunit Na+/H+ antiporter MnhB subunit